MGMQTGRTGVAAGDDRNMPEANELDLPPGYESVRLRESGDAFAHACAIAGARGAGTLVWVSRYDLIEFAVVLEPGEPLMQARRGFFVGMNAIANALATHCPPERDFTFAWPDAILLDHGLIGGAQLGWPETCREDEVPEWLVFGVLLRAADLSHFEPGETPSVTALTNEGFELVSGEAIIESFARHLMTAFDLWGEKGFRAIGEDYLERLPRRLAAEKRIIDANGDLIVSLPAAARPDRISLTDSLAAIQWLDRASRYPKSSFVAAGAVS